MSYTPSYQSSYSTPQPHPTPSYYSATPPAPPPKPSSTEARGPPLPPPPPGQAQNEPSELDGSQGYQYQQRQPSQAAPRQQIDIPPIEAGWLPEGLRENTTIELHDLLNDHELQAALLNNPTTTHPAIPASQSPLHPLLSSNISLAQHLTTLEGQLTHKRSQTQSRLLALRALEQQHRAKITETERALEQFSPMALYQRLSGSVQEQEQLLRGMEESWLEEEQGATASEREVGEFVRRVKEARKVGFLRGERKERWDEGRVGGWR